MGSHAGVGGVGCMQRARKGRAEPVCSVPEQVGYVEVVSDRWIHTEVWCGVMTRRGV